MAGYRGNVAATTNPEPSPGGVPSVATWWPSRGEPVARTTSDHGPEPWGGWSRFAGAPGSSASRAAISPAPMTTGQAPRPRRRSVPISPRISSAAMARATTAPTGLTPSSPAASAAAMAPIARRALRPISANRHEVPELVERLLADELPGPEIVDRRERLLLAGSQDLAGGHRPDPGQGVELGGCRTV